MSDNRYNGWRNYETWLCNLWFDNFFVEDAANMYAMAEDESEAIMLLESYIEDTVTELVMGGIDDASGFLPDIMGAVFRIIDFREIAEHYIDDAVIEMYKENLSEVFDS